MKLTSQNVEILFLSLLFKEGEDTTNHIEARGVMTHVGFHPERLENAKPEIEKLLSQLPNEFKESSGGGMSFLNACMTAEGDQWGEHRNIDQLLCIGVATEKAHIQFPRMMWKALPGGMPYFSVLDNSFANKA